MILNDGPMAGLLDDDKLKFDPYGGGAYLNRGGYNSTDNQVDNANSTNPGSWTDVITVGLKTVKDIFSKVTGGASTPTPSVAQPSSSAAALIPIAILAGTGFIAYRLLKKKRA